MAKAREGSGRHRQALIPVRCPACGLEAQGRRTLPNRPLWIKTHFDQHGQLCPPLRLGESRPAPRFTRPIDDDQLSLF